MRVQELHGWQVSPAQAQEIQRRLAAQVCRENQVASPRFIAGLDISSEGRGGLARGAAVVLRYPELTLVEVRVVEGRPGFPYVPGLLSFREAPLVLAACQRLVVEPDLVLADGQGLAHPRRLGLACHLGLLLDKPTIGCAKSRLLGIHQPVGMEPGSYAELVDEGEVIGAALRTKAGGKPLYVSIGHRVDLPAAIRWVMACLRADRLPEPARLAHLAASGRLAEMGPEVAQSLRGGCSRSGKRRILGGGK